jgi:hypothetical protein
MDMKVEQHVIIKFLCGEGADHVERHSRLLNTFQEDAYTLSSIYEWIKAFQTSRTSVVDEYQSELPRLNYIDSEILSLFQENEFHNTRSLAGAGAESFRKYLYDRLIHVLRFSLRHLR